ncbi:ATP synthase subunit C lysine N-methyltransferase isoform X1 [Engystomops pustulosus]|uniref:ATP synthase subunit C lysine N-methyltransferase isoform X1 n=1 Tax=Engystomops pustulosus TaxID=76066 RepID=UPI003AFAD207
MLISFTTPGEPHTSMRLWRINPFWLTQPLVTSNVPGDLTQFFEAHVDCDSQQWTWETMKIFLRGVLMIYVSVTKSRTRALDEAMHLEMRRAEADFIENPTDLIKDRLRQAQGVINTHLLEGAARKRMFMKQRFFEEGEKVGHLLSVISKAQQGATHIGSLKAPNGVVCTDVKSILDVLQTFYADLYTTRMQASDRDIENFLAKLSLPQLSAEHRDMLEGPLTLEEIEEATQAMANDKAPGVDGMPMELYKKFGGILLPKLLKVFEESFEKGDLPRSMKEAIIVVIPKEGKDPQVPESYRPISLLSTDVKILAKTLSNRLIRVIPSIIHSDQTGFMPQKSTSINIRRLLLNLQIPADNIGQRAVLTLDAAKAFDSVEWQYLWEVMRVIGFGPNFISWVKVLYSANGELSEWFPLTRGTRQGCPLSPMLFSIAIEPLAAAVRLSPDIEGFRCGQLHNKIALYTDDALLFLGDTGPLWRRQCACWMNLDPYQALLLIGISRP